MALGSFKTSFWEHFIIVLKTFWDFKFSPWLYHQFGIFAFSPLSEAFPDQLRLRCGGPRDSAPWNTKSSVDRCRNMMDHSFFILKFSPVSSSSSIHWRRTSNLMVVGMEVISLKSSGLSLAQRQARVPKQIEFSFGFHNPFRILPILTFSGGCCSQ